METRGGPTVHRFFFVFIIIIFALHILSFSRSTQMVINRKSPTFSLDCVYKIWVFVLGARSLMFCRRLSSPPIYQVYFRQVAQMSSQRKEYGFATRAVHAGQSPDKWEMGQVVPPISLATTYKQPLPGEPKVYDYSRAGNPTRDALQENLAALEVLAFFVSGHMRITCLY